MTKNKNNIFLLQDLAIILLSIVFAITLIKFTPLEQIVTATEGAERIASFISGMFFTSVFTTSPAIAVLSEIGQKYSIINTAFFGALGAVIGDLIIFRFVRDRFSVHLMTLLKQKGSIKRFTHLFKLPFFRWFTFFIGGIIIASPLPDELGISILGFSKVKPWLFVFVSFVFNFIGIYLIITAARIIQ